MNQPPNQLTIGDAEIRATAKLDLYYFAKVILGYKDMSPTLHRELCQFIQDKTNLRKIILIPRSHFKSSTVTISYVAWRVVNNPNLRVLITSSTATNAEKFLREIGQHFTRNETFQKYFPEMIPNLSDKKNKWTETELTVPRTKVLGEATITAAGVGGTKTGNHYDIIIKDDLVDEQTNFDGAPMEQILNWHKYAEGLFDNPAKGEDIIVGTRYHYNDPYQHVIDNEPAYVQYIRQAIENGQPIFPERFTLETLAMIRAKQGPVVFSNQYMNDPIDEASVKFKEEHLQPTLEFPRDLMVFMLTDTIGESVSGEDYFATTCWGVDPNVDEIGLNDIYLLDIIDEKLDIDSAVQAVIAMYKRCRPMDFAIERAGQSTFGLHVRNYFRQHGGHIHISEVTPAGRNKNMRILGLLPYALNGKVFVNKGIVGTPSYQRFVQEWTRFPRSKRDDGLDSSAYVLDMIERYKSSLNYGDEEPEEEEVAFHGIGPAGY